MNVRKPTSLEQAAGQMLLLSFRGKHKPAPELLEIVRSGRAGGVVLFRHKNTGTLQQLRELTHALQSAARNAAQPLLIIAADQEGGQLMALGEGTCFPGNMALGATRSTKLSYQMGRALGKELSAVGINVDFAPVCDVNNNPQNPVIGTRSFGEDPKLVASLSSAMIRGIQSSGVAATAKHFPGHGDTSGDSHHSTPVLKRTAGEIYSLELVPFRAAITRGTRLVMTSHIVVPSLNGRNDTLPATLSPQILRELLRGKLGFRGVIVSDALDMHALQQGDEYIAETIAAAAAGNDLLLFNHEIAKAGPAFYNLVQAARRSLLSPSDLRDSAARISALKRWLSRQPRFDLDVIRCNAHLELAREIARRSITLVRDNAGYLPLRLSGGARVAVVIPQPEDLTPADTSSYVRPSLGEALRRFHKAVDQFSLSLDPGEPEMRALIDRLSGYDVVIVGTIEAHRYPRQAKFVQALIEKGVKMITVALRLPYDIAAYPQAQTHLCAYSILPPTMEALADGLFGRIAFRGRLPVSIPPRMAMN